MNSKVRKALRAEVRAMRESIAKVLCVKVADVKMCVGENLELRAYVCGERFDFDLYNV